MDTLTFIDGVLYFCLMTMVVVLAVIVIFGIDLALASWRIRKVEKYNNAGHRFFDRLK